jgi:IS5 family transposase
MVHKPLGSQGSLSDWMMPDHAALHALDGLDHVVDWARLEALCAGIYASRNGRPSTPIRVLLRALLLGAWYGLSDVKLEAALVRDLLFRRFCGLSMNDGAPDHSTLSRFRAQLVEKRLWKTIFEEVNRQLTAQNIIIAQGQVSIIDASVVEAHQARAHTGRDGRPTQDPEAGWHVKGSGRKKTSTYGYSVHVNCDEDGFILKQDVTSGAVHDSQKREELMTGHESELYADSAYASAKTDADLAARGCRNRVQRKGYRNRPISDEDRARNKQIAFTRGRVEAIFGSYKSPQHRNARKTRFLGLLKNVTQFGLMAMMHNLQKAARFVALYGILQQKPQENYA